MAGIVCPPLQVPGVADRCLVPATPEPLISGQLESSAEALQSLVIRAGATAQCPSGIRRSMSIGPGERGRISRWWHPTLIAVRFLDMPAKKTARKTSKRTVIEPHKGDRRYVRRNKKGEFKKEVNVGRSLSADRRSKAKTKVKKGQGDRGDVKR